MRTLPEETSCEQGVHDEILEENITCHGDKATLCPKNVDVDSFNENILQTLPGVPQVYQSADAVEIGDNKMLIGQQRNEANRLRLMDCQIQELKDHELAQLKKRKKQD